MRCQVQLQQLQEGLGIERGHRAGAACAHASVRFSSFSRRRSSLVASARVASRVPAVQQPRQQERQRLQSTPPGTPARFRPRSAAAPRAPAACDRPRRAPVRAGAGLPRPGARQSPAAAARPVPETGGCPSGRAFPQFRRGREQGQRQRPQKLALIALRKDADAAKAARRADGRVRIGRERQVGLHPRFGGPLCHRRRHVLGKAEQPVEPRRRRA